MLQINVIMTGIEREGAWKDEALEYLRYIFNIRLEVLRKTPHSVLQDSPSPYYVSFFFSSYGRLILYLQDLSLSCHGSDPRRK
jgi:hypothetical protein